MVLPKDLASLNTSRDLTYNSFYQPLDTADISGMVNYSPKFINNDPDTIVYPKYLAMSPEGQPTFRNGNFPITDFPPGQFGTRMKTIITPTNTGNYVFYLAADDTALLSRLSTDANPANEQPCCGWFGGHRLLNRMDRWGQREFSTIQYK